MLVSANSRSTVTEEGIVIMDVSNGNIFHSNSIGALIWTSLKEGASVQGIVELITSRYSVSRKEAEADVFAYIRALTSKGLLLEE